MSSETVTSRTDHLEKIRPARAHPLLDYLTVVNKEARDHAETRLSRLFPPASLDAIGGYFQNKGLFRRVSSPSVEHRNYGILEALLDDITSVPSIFSTSATDSLNLKIWYPPGQSSFKMLPLEAGSSAIMANPVEMYTMIKYGASVEVRQMDRHLIQFTPVVDDVAALTRADVYAKLFLAGGSTSANGSHSDNTDVLALLLAGEKYFWVQSPESGAIGRNDASLRPGDAVRVPRGWRHLVVPSGAPSALLSFGLMRIGDWAFRGSVPSHLGYSGYPTSAMSYSVALRSHIPQRSLAGDGENCLFSRCPGGIVLLEQPPLGEVIMVAASGSVFSLTNKAVAILAETHRLAGRPLCDVASAAAVKVQTAREICRELARHGLLTSLPASKVVRDYSLLVDM